MIKSIPQPRDNFLAPPDVQQNKKVFDNKNKKTKIPNKNDGGEGEIDGYVSDDPSISNRIPESHIKFNNQLLTGRPSNLPQNTEGDESGSPYKEYANQQPTKKAHSTNHYGPQAGYQDNDTMKRLLYSKSPKEAAHEYLTYSTKMMQPNRSTGNIKNNISPSKNKSYPYPFNGQQTTGSGEKENMHRSQSPKGFNNMMMGSQDSTLSRPKTGQIPKAMKSSDFDSAYTELANKLYNQKLRESSQGRDTGLGNKSGAVELLLSPQQARDIQVKKTVNPKEQEDVAHRLIRHGQIINEHTKALTEAYINRELEECTFAPKTNPVATERRTVSTFLEDQNKFLQNCELKKKKIQEKVQAEQVVYEPTYKPEICKGTLKILEKRQQAQQKSGTANEKDDAQVHNRLYKISKNANQKQMAEVAEGDDVNDPKSNQTSQFIGPLTGKSHQVAPNLEITFVPNIQQKSKNLKRGEKIDNILYNDAMRRQHKSMEIGRVKPKGPVKNMSDASKRALATRFIKEFDTAIVEFLEVGKEPKLDYLACNEFLKRMSFLRDAEQVDAPHFTPERILLYDMWYTVFADKNKGVHRRNLLVFLLAVLGLHYQITKIAKTSVSPGGKTKSAGQMNRDEEDENGNIIKKGGAKEGKDSEIDDDHSEDKSGVYDPSALLIGQNPELGQRPRRLIGTIDEAGNFELAPEDVKKIKKFYDIWYMNRLCSTDNVGQMITNRYQEDHAYHPEILETSKHMAQTYREKILEETANLIQNNKIQAPKDGKLTHADLLVLTKKVVKEKTLKMGEEVSKEKLKECSFKPQTNDFAQNSKMLGGKTEEDGKDSETGRKQAMPTASLGKNRALELYSLAKPRTSKKDREKHEVEYEKNCDECTFTPDISNTRGKKLGGSTEVFAKNIDKTIDRLRSARADRDQMNLYNQRGFINGQEDHFVFSLDNKKHQPQASQTTVATTQQQPQQQLPSTTGQRTTGSVERENISPNVNAIGNTLKSKPVSKNPIPSGATYKTSEKSEKSNHSNDINVNAPTAFNAAKMLREPLNADRDNRASGMRGEDDEDGELHGQPTNFEKYGIESELERESEPENDRVPLLFVDVNLGQGRTERIVVFEGDKSEELAKKFADEHGLDQSMRGKLKELLDSQIAGLLSRIDEEANSVHSDTERDGGLHHHPRIQEEDDLAEQGSYRTTNQRK